MSTWLISGASYRHIRNAFSRTVLPYDLLPYCLLRSCGIDKSTAQAGADTLRGNLPF